MIKAPHACVAVSSSRFPHTSKSRLFFYSCVPCPSLSTFLFVKVLWPLGPSEEYLADYEDSMVGEVRCAAEFTQGFHGENVLLVQAYLCASGLSFITQANVLEENPIKALGLT